MNKILLTTALIFPAITFAVNDISDTNSFEATAIEYEEDIVSLSQAAINPRGVCKVFINENEIPETWKSVDSCKNYTSVKTGASPEDVLKRRWQRRLAARSARTNTVKKKNVLGRARIGSGTLTRGGADRVKSLGIKQRARRMTTRQQFGSTKKFLLNDSRRLKKSSEERVRRRNARSGIKSGSATKMSRSGQMSGKFWSTESARRNQRLDAQETNEGWKKYLNNRQYLSKKGRKAKKKYVYKGLSLRKMYRGTHEGKMEE